jgi:hypothetical protein
MENSDVADWANETLQSQFHAVHDATNTSTVCAYGDASIATMTLAQFFGVTGSARAPRSDRKLSLLSEPVSSRDVPIKILQSKIEATTTSAEAAYAQAALHAELSARELIDQRFSSISRILAAGDDFAASELLAPLPRSSSCTDPDAVSDFACAERAFDAYTSICGGFTDYSLKYFKLLRRACANKKMQSEIELALKQVC